MDSFVKGQNTSVKHDPNIQMRLRTKYPRHPPEDNRMLDPERIWPHLTREQIFLTMIQQ